MAWLATALAVPMVALVVWLVFFPPSFWVDAQDMPAVAPSFSPDGRTLGVLALRNGDASDRTWGVLRLPAEGKVVLHNATRRGRRATTWATQVPPDGRSFVWGGERRIAFTSRNDNITVVDLERPDRTERTFEGFRPSFSPDGRLLAYEARPERSPPSGLQGYGYDEYDDDAYRPSRRNQREVHLHDFERDKTTRLTTGGGRNPAWSPDGQWIAYEIDVFGVEKRKHTYRWGSYSHDYYSSVPVWKGTRLAVIPAAGGEPTVLAEEGVNRYPRWPGGDADHVTWLHWNLKEIPEAAAAEAAPAKDGVDARVAGPSLLRASVDGGSREEILSFGLGAVGLHRVGWMPDGSGVVYTGLTVGQAELAPEAPDEIEASMLSGKVDLFYLDLATGVPTRLAGGAARMAPAMSPDGERIAWVELVEGEPRVRVSRWSAVEP